MPELSVSGIVLRRKDAGESDRRLTLLTQELGKIDVTAKGARKAASRLAGVSEPLSTAVFGLAAGKRNRFVTQAQPMSSFRGLRTDYDRLSFALALLELYAAVLPFDEPNPDAFDLLVVSLKQLETHEKPLVANVWAQTTLLSLSGFLPQFGSCVACDEPVKAAVVRLSPRAGGIICSDHIYPDSFDVRAEVAIGLSRIAELEAPPANLKFADECFNALLPFWRYNAETALPANDALQQHLHSERMRTADAESR